MDGTNKVKMTSEMKMTSKIGPSLKKKLRDVQQEREVAIFKQVFIE